jgi:hypothetical protein
MVPSVELQERNLELLRKIAQNECGKTKTLKLNHETVGYLLRTSRCLKQLTHALMQNTSITKLNLYGQRIGSFPEGIKHFAKMLEKNKTLTSINLTKNHISIEDIYLYLLPAIKKNTTLLHLDLAMNTFLKIPENYCNYMWRATNKVPTGEELMTEINTQLELNRALEQGVSIDKKSFAEIDGNHSDSSPKITYQFKQKSSQKQSEKIDNIAKKSHAGSDEIVPKCRT